MPRKRSDPARTLELLWRQNEPSSHGPRPTLSVDRIVATATALADSDGLQAVTMRRIADRLGVVPMSLYTYVPGKAELLDLMADDAYARMPRATHRGRHWRARLTQVANANRELYERHPWLTEIPASRPPLGPGLMAKYDHELGALEGTGLGDTEMDACLTYLLGFVQQTARAAAATRAAESSTGMNDEQWWAAHEPLLVQVFDPARYPTAARVGTAAGTAQKTAYDADHAYEFGLQRVLDGLAALIDQRRRRNR